MAAHSYRCYIWAGFMTEALPPLGRNRQAWLDQTEILPFESTDLMKVLDFVDRHSGKHLEPYRRDAYPNEINWGGIRAALHGPGEDIFLNRVREDGSLWFLTILVAKGAEQFRPSSMIPQQVPPVSPAPPPAWPPPGTVPLRAASPEAPRPAPS